MTEIEFRMHDARVVFEQGGPVLTDGTVRIRLVPPDGSEPGDVARELGGVGWQLVAAVANCPGVPKREPIGAPRWM